MNEANLQTLLKRTADLIKHHQEIEEARGEKFNIFTILGVESKENQTHSNFIAELLDPQGSHQKGHRFVELFLESIPVNLEGFDLKTCLVKTEHPAGKIDWELESGGRIDILISNENQEIRIENKVFAGDQKLQLVRYNKGENKNLTILYLTLDGREASEASKGSLISGVDYHPISYKSHINSWLEKCQKEAYNAPILRETIRQYQILIQKLTGTMAQNEQQKLQALILENIHEAELIAKNFERVKAEIAKAFRHDLILELQDALPEHEVKEGSETNASTSQIWILSKTKAIGIFRFGIESFSISRKNHHDGKLFIGTFCDGKDKSIRAKYSNDFIWFSDYWFDISVFSANEDTALEFHQNDFVKALAKDALLREKLLKCLAEEIKIYVDQQTLKIQRVLTS